MRREQKIHLLTLSSGTLLSLGGLVSIIISVDPIKANGLIFGLFYLTLFLTLAGLVTILIFLLRSKFLAALPTDHFGSSARQGILIGIMGTAILLLQSQKLLFWWVTIPIILFFGLIEIFVHTNKRHHATQ